jgi:hypothetical protein
VVDDWTKGYSIYKVDVADFDGADPGADLDSAATPLPGPPAFRLESCHASYSCPWFSSVGSKIAAMRYNDEQEDAPVLLYDTATGGLAVGPRTPAEARFAGTFVPNNGADDRLYMMGTSKFRDGEDNFQVLAEEGGRWAWSSLPTPPFRTSKAASDAACCATHPDGRTIFFSVYAKGTFSFDTETHEWKRHGDWMLPFLGLAYYDAQLDAWVGIDSSAPEKGGVCSCAVAAAGVFTCILMNTQTFVQTKFLYVFSLGRPARSPTPRLFRLVRLGLSQAHSTGDSDRQCRACLKSSAV